MKTNRKSSTKGSRNQKADNKEPYIAGLYDKMAIELAEVGIPLCMETCPDTEGDEPTLADKEHYGKLYTVADGSFYTIRLGIHSSSLGIGAMDENCAVACAIPATPDETQWLMALFFIPEIEPVKFMDGIWLRAEKGQKFRVEYVYGSAALEANNDSKALPLRHDAVIDGDDYIVILQNGLDGEIPAFCTFSYDFLRFQIKVIYVE